MEHSLRSSESHWISISLPLLCEETDNAESILYMFSWQAAPQRYNWHLPCETTAKSDS